MSAVADGRWRCPGCGAESRKCYRCTECGHDLAAEGPSGGNRGGQS